MPYWKNQYNQKIIEKFNQLDLDVRMRIVGSTLPKTKPKAPAASLQRLPQVSKLRASSKAV